MTFQTCVIIAAFFLAVASFADAGSPKNPSPLAPFLPRQKKKYTPLLFFTSPKGEMAECEYGVPHESVAGDRPG